MQPLDSASAATDDEEAAHARLLPQLRMMLRALLASTVGKRLVLLSWALLVIIVATAYGQIRLNRWNKPFFDALSRRDFMDFLVQLGVFFLIAGGLLILNVIQRWVTETLKLKLREGLVLDLLHDWMRPRRALMLANAGAMGVNPDQRMHEDTRHLCELSADLGGGLLQSSILLVVFVGVLWVISSPFVVRIAEHDYAIPGYMVWAAVLYAGVGSLLSYWVGRSLIPRNAERYAQEADLRFSLVRVNEHLDGISLAGGEAGETRRVEQHLASVLAAMRRLVTGLTNLTWVTAGFGWVTQVAPIIVAAPLYFQGTLSFGGLMMAAAAFNQAQSSLRWFVDNFSVIADWRATLLRVASFRRALMMADSLGETESQINYEEGPSGEMQLDALEVVSFSGRDMLKERHLKVRRGERLLIVAHPGTSKTQLFRALAGLWPWGSGRIIRPKDEPIFYLPRGTPYLPRGTLRELLAYPGRAEDFTESAYLHALRRMGLERLVAMLPETHRWERQLSQDEQLSLAVARIVLQRPPWLIVDDTFDGLDRETLERVVDIFASELEHTSVIQIRSSALRDPLFSRVAHLVKVPSASPTARKAALPLALLLGVALLWPALKPAAAAEQMFPFHEPTLLSDAATTSLMRDLALRVLPVYQDLDRTRFLATLSALQLVTGDYTAAYGARQALRQRLNGATPMQPIEQSVVYDIYARTRAIETEQREPFGRAFSESFDAFIPPLDDLTDYAVTSWFGTPLSVFQDALQSALTSVRGQKSIPLSKALELILAYLAYQVHLYTGPQADELITEDDQFRYIIDDQIVVRTADGLRIPATSVRPRGAAARLPALLEFTIYRDPQNYAKECAAHGYVGVVAYTSGRLTARDRGVLPYERDGAEARAVIDWIARQPWSDGRVAMYGTGYSAFTAWAAAKHAPSALKAIATSSAMAPGIDAPMVGNIFLNSAYRFASEADSSEPFNPLMEIDDSYWRALNQAWYRSGRPYDQLDFMARSPNPLFHRWLSHPSYDRYWQAMIPYREEFAHIHIPVLAVTGYYASDEAGTLYYLAEHERYAPHNDDTLLIGPYDDQALEQGPSAVLRGYHVDPVALVDLHELRYRWFDSILRGAARPPLLQGRVNFEVTGANQWRHVASLAGMGDGSVRFYLDPAASDLPPAGAVHLLAEQKPAKVSFLQQTVNLADRGDADWTAPPELQAQLIPMHYSVVFASAPLRQPTELDGAFSGQLDVLLNRTDLDVTLALYQRLPDGSYLKLFDPVVEFRASYALDRSHRHPLTSGARQQLKFRSDRLLSRTLASGSRLLLVLSVNKRPDQELNYGSGKAVSAESIADAKTPVMIRWYDDSYIDIPAELPTR